jgi:hypothetical protein
MTSIMTAANEVPFVPALRLLCEATIELRAGGPIALGQSPWSSRRVADIAGGRFEGPHLRGRILASGADWSERGIASDGEVQTRLDVRSLWETDDGATIYVVYGGRMIVPPDVLAEFSDPSRVDTIDPSRYYFRTNPLFETASPRYAWLNRIVAVGVGQRTGRGVVYRLFEVL